MTVMTMLSRSRRARNMAAGPYRPVISSFRLHLNAEGKSRSIDRYIRLRGNHARTASPKLWLGVNNRQPMTANGIYQMIARRGQQCGVVVHPHKFRHHFSHSWLDKGGNEGDLMELNGRSSPQMLQRYGASARNARARRTYDRIMSDGR